MIKYKLDYSYYDACKDFLNKCHIGYIPDHMHTGYLTLCFFDEGDFVAFKLRFGL